jgi:hypothetical protein
VKLEKVAQAESREGKGNKLMIVMNQKKEFSCDDFAFAFWLRV